VRRVSELVGLPVIVMKISFMLALLCFGIGCYPYRQLSRPGVTGLVVDSQRDLPVAGAQVTLSGALVALPPSPDRDPQWYIQRGQRYPSHTIRTVSVTDGTFNILPRHRWELGEIHFSRWGTFYALTVSRDGYHTFTNVFWYAIEKVPASETCTNLGRIRLEPIVE